MDSILEFIKPELLVLVVVLYFIGLALKKSTVADKYIPVILGGGGIALAALWVLATSTISSWQEALLAVFTAVVQGVLVAGCSVYVNQIVKQAQKDE